MEAYLQLRRNLGYIALIFPFLLIGLSLITENGCKENILPTISDYYHSNLRNVFVGTICAIAVFLWSYDVNDFQEKVFCKFAAIFALLVGFAPTGKCDFPCLVNDGIEHVSMISKIHYISAASFFIILAFLSYKKFAERETGTNKASRYRIKVYKACGLGMFVSIILIALYQLYIKENVKNLDQALLPPTFALESISLILFSIAWLVQGELMFQNNKGILRVND